MRVRPKTEAQLRELGGDARKFVSTYFPYGDTGADITTGTDYVVVAIRGTEFGPLFYIEDDTENGLPVPYPGPLLSMTDTRAPELWDLEESTARLDPDDEEWLGPAFWREQGDLFYERLLDGCEAEMANYRAYHRALTRL